MMENKRYDEIKLRIDVERKNGHDGIAIGCDEAKVFLTLNKNVCSEVRCLIVVIMDSYTNGTRIFYFDDRKSDLELEDAYDDFQRILTLLKNLN